MNGGRSHLPGSGHPIFARLRRAAPLEYTGQEPTTTSSFLFAGSSPAPLLPHYNSPQRGVATKAAKPDGPVGFRVRTNAHEARPRPWIRKRGPMVGKRVTTAETLAPTGFDSPPRSKRSEPAPEEGIDAGSNDCCRYHGSD